MEQKKEGKKTVWAAILMLNAASIVVLFSSIFAIQFLSIAYGTAAGAIIQSKQDNTNVTSILAQNVANIGHIYASISEAYLLLIIALLSEGIAFMLWAKESARSGARKYAAMHAALIIIFAMLYYIIVSNLSFANISFYTSIASVGIAFALISDAYTFSFAPSRRQGKRVMISINPSTPFRNALELQEKLFSQINGNLRIVDKHFNSSSLSNLYRLISPYLKNISAIRIITSKEMLDKNFAANYNDLKAELARNNIELELRIMDEQAATEQHERFIFDSSNAYKIPPINIITRKSEHIVKMSLSDAKKRYEELYKRSIKFENFYSIAKSEEKQ